MLDPYTDGPAAYVLMQRGGEDAELQLGAARKVRLLLDPASLAAVDEERIFRFQAARAKLPCVGLRPAAEPAPQPTRITLSFGWGMR